MITFIFSGEDHQRDDWLSIHEQICPIVGVVRSAQPHAISEEERTHRKHQQTLRKVGISSNQSMYSSACVLSL